MVLSSSGIYENMLLLSPAPLANTHALDLERGGGSAGDAAAYLITGGETIDLTGTMTVELTFQTEQLPVSARNYTFASVWGPAGPLLGWQFSL